MGQAEPFHFRFFKGYLPQILHGSFLNTLTHMNFGPALIAAFISTRG